MIDDESVLSLLVSVAELGMTVRPEVKFRLVVPLDVALTLGYVVAVTRVDVDPFEFVVECGTPSTVLLYHLEVTRLAVVF